MEQIEPIENINNDQTIVKTQISKVAKLDEKDKSKTERVMDY
jgi:hypothetical protein